MPIYEFYCPSCNTIYSFLSRTVNTAKLPSCPGCKRQSLTRKVSLFAVTGRAKEGGGDDDTDLPIDESKMERAMETLAGEAENLNEDDPRQAAGLMRKLSDLTGIQYGEKMQEAIGRMEAGEDPEAVEAEMGDALEQEEPIIMPDKKGKAGGRPSPRRDETLYEL
jgi:putative FmdB family regulatory protein